MSARSTHEAPALLASSALDLGAMFRVLATFISFECETEGLTERGVVTHG